MKYLRIVMRSLVALAIFVSVLEISARVDDKLSYRAPFWGPYGTSGLYIHDELGQWGRPYGRYQKWKLNSLGYRGPELRPGAIRIVCLGASETFGLYEDPGQEYPRQLERDLNSQWGGDILQVVNAAYPGETVGTATRRVPRIVAQVHPEIAIIYPSAATYIWLPWLADNPASHNQEERTEESTAFGDQWRIYGRVHDLLKSAVPQDIQTKLREFTIRMETSEYPVLARVPEENVLVFQRDLSELVDTLRQNGVEPVLVTHATEFSSPLTSDDQALLVAWRKFFPMLEEEGFIDMEKRMNNAIRFVSSQNGVVLIDMENKIPHGRTDFADFSHFTDVGSSTMAAGLADGLKPVIGTLLAKRDMKTPEVGISGNLHELGRATSISIEMSEAEPSVHSAAH
jgi:hypothetical protein